MRSLFKVLVLLASLALAMMVVFVVAQSTFNFATSQQAYRNHPSGATYFKTLVYSVDVYSASTSSGVSSFDGVYVAQRICELLAGNVQDRLRNAHLSSNTTLQKDAKDGVECLCVRQWVARHVVHRLYCVFVLFLGFGFLRGP